MKLRLKELRKMRYMTQEQLSEKSGVTRATIGRLERGEEIETTTKTLCALADALDVSISDIFLSEVVN